MFSRILNAFRNTTPTAAPRAARQAPRFGVEPMESRRMMSTTGTFTLTFNGQTTAASGGDHFPLEEISFSYGKVHSSILVGMLLPAIQKVR